MDDLASRPEGLSSGESDRGQAPAAAESVPTAVKPDEETPGGWFRFP